MRQTLVIISIIALLFLVSCQNTQYNEFSQCLTDEDAKMYGAYWCPHCTEQKNMFGASWDIVNYVECSLPNRAGQTEVCKQADIRAYPTWEFADGERVEGKLSFEQLAQRTGCQLPA